MNFIKRKGCFLLFKNVKHFSFYKKSREIILQNTLRKGKDKNNESFFYGYNGLNRGNETNGATFSSLAKSANDENGHVVLGIRQNSDEKKKQVDVGDHVCEEIEGEELNDNSNAKEINRENKIGEVTSFEIEKGEDKQDVHKNNDEVTEEQDDDNDEDDKYAKSFYEIYDDNDDTYDCPEDLLKFIKKEHMNIKIKIKCSSPRNMKKSDVKNVINNMFEECEKNAPDNWLNGEGEEGTEKDGEKANGEAADVPNYDIYYLNSEFKNFNYPDRNVLWPNPLVYNHRIQPFVLRKRKDVNASEHFECDKRNMEINKTRLQNLWCYSSSYGVDWDTLDALYLNYKNHKSEHLNEWENNKNKIMLYASKVSKRKLIKSRKQLLDKLNIDYSDNVYVNYDDKNAIQEDNLDDDQTEYNLLFPRSIFRKWTRTLYFYWKDRYMHYYNNTLCDYLKGEVVDLQLLREQNERNLHLSKKKMLSKHSFSLKPVKGSNLYITRYVKKKNLQVKDNDAEFDLTGVGENIYNTVQKKK
ncbi:conserved Plasmodium protein, unknown function [Plasmodium malariae]|uniref:Uncharacterized protein n=1 Tax=Plasmodium malariae TaxID=5858 RepID=A0A1D3JIN3_PLAMA|nr:conserved Plasmodium protein, unknown function [Plasmodium malariae]SBT86232.1 conserved Plasmodium protein, unknown function [Plasmodium malariae]